MSEAVPYRVRKIYPKTVFLDNFLELFLCIAIMDGLPYRLPHLKKFYPNHSIISNFKFQTVFTENLVVIQEKL